MNKMLNRREVLDKAIHDCYREMYAKAQPSADWDQIVQEFKDGKRDKDERVYEQHYLSQEEYTYIVEKYLNAYNILSHWKEDVEVVEEYLREGGSKDKYIPDEYDDNGELVSPGHRGYEKVLPIKEQILQEMSKWLSKEESQTAANNITKIVMDTIDECKKFYRFDREESSFRITAALGASPTSNPESVKKYWKEKTGEDIQIEERNPKLFWYIDEGYTDEDLEYEFDDPNWKENLDKEWKDELEKRAQKHNENLKKLEKRNEK